MISAADVEAAAGRLRGVANRTPALTSRTLDERTGVRAFLKAENLQRIGAFKFRGAYNAVTALAPDAVAAVSSGNHAQAVALAARLHGIPATIIMPEDAPASKLAATRGYGAEVILYDRYGEDRDQLLADLAAERGVTAIHPYDEDLVQAGQGTAALELLQDTGGLDALLVPVGGGGLIAGSATVAEAAGVRVIGVEPEAGDDFRRSLAAGKRIDIGVPRTIADGQQASVPGRLTFPVVQARVERIVTVTDAQILEAMAFAFERMKTVLEPSGASALAALLAGAAEVEGRVGVILSGGNVAIDRFRELLARTAR